MSTNPSGELSPPNPSRDKLLQALDDVQARLSASEARCRRLQSELRSRTSEKQSEIEQARANLLATLESIGDGFFACDGNWRFVYVNRLAEKLLDIRREEVLGRGLWEVFPLSLGTRLEREYRRAAGGEIRDFDNFYAPWGRWFHNRCFPREGGGMSVYFSDISARKRSEEKIRYKSRILEGINQIFHRALVCRTETEVGRVCLEVAERLTASRFSFLGKLGEDARLYDVAISEPGRRACRVASPTGHRLVPSELPLRGIFGRVLQGQKGFYTNTPATHPDRVGVPEGHPSLQAFLGVPMTHGDRPIGMVAVANREGGYGDAELEALEALAPAISHALVSWQARTALNQIQERFLKIFRHAAMGIAITDWEGRYQHCNPAYCALLGYREEELRGAEFARFIFPADRKANMMEIERLKSGELPFFEIKNRYLRKDGRPIWVHKFLSVLPDEEGRPAHLMALISDISLQMKADRELEELNRILSQRSSLAEEQAADIRQLAMDLTRAEDKERRRLAMVLHDDLQQMLAYLKLKLTTLNMGDGVGQAPSDVVDLIDRCIDRCRNLSHELDSSVLVKKGLLEALKRLCDQMGEMHGMVVSLQSGPLPEKASHVLTSMLVRCVRELLFNVVKHSGGKCATVDARMEGARLRVSVRDAGLGCDLNCLGEKQERDGAFGLFSIKDRVRLMGGEMHLESSPGGGFCVRLDVPLAFSDLSGRAAAAPPSPAQIRS